MVQINTTKYLIRFAYLCFPLLCVAWYPPSVNAQQSQQWITFEPASGAGNGKHIVLVSGDEEYRSEEALPMLAKILARHHGFKTTVLFAINPKTGEIDPEYQTNIPGLQQLPSADLIVMLMRFRELPEDQMKYVDAYIKSGKPIVALRTATHAFAYSRNKKSPYAKYSFDSDIKGWEGGFGRQVLGETWIAHHGDHGAEGTRGLINGELQAHPVLRGVHDIWCPTDVYAVTSLQGNPDVLVWGLPTQGMSPESAPNWHKSVMPVAWVREYTGENGRTGRIFTTTMGASVDLQSEDLRRLLVNACYWALKMEEQMAEKSDVDMVGTYRPTMFGFGKHQKGLRPVDFAMDKKN